VKSAEQTVRKGQLKRAVRRSHLNRQNREVNFSDNTVHGGQLKSSTERSVKQTVQRVQLDMKYRETNWTQCREVSWKKRQCIKASWTDRAERSVEKKRLPEQSVHEGQLNRKYSLRGDWRILGRVLWRFGDSRYQTLISLEYSVT
jgi:hypothetical protein